ncbi:HalOD1 output domain-containing protein [Halomicrococcus sp. NG-SE-24]|uniref:HalOD1 output domain-containing protein n=1 Tax=Halomicrococcus sp. NG-SE-24 TaxID=3436928 RepID=UPI003D98FAF0
MASITAKKPLDCTYGSCASIAVIEALEQYNGVDPHDSEFRLYDVVDPDALDTLFSGQQTTGLSVEFDIDDVTVSISRTCNDIQVHITDTFE